MTAVIGLVALGGLLTWALCPLPASDSSPSTSLIKAQQTATNQEDESASPDVVEQEQIDVRDLAAFQVDLWNPPPVAGSGTDTALAGSDSGSTSAMSTLELIGIIREADGNYKAALYDPGSDRIFVVGTGERIEDFMIESVDDSAVVVSDGDNRQRLALEPQPDKQEG